MKLYTKTTFLILLLGISLTFVENIYGQDDYYDDRNMQNSYIPPAPSVSELRKYVEIPVGLYTGVPNISIPLYEIKTGDITLPITLTYHSSGIKIAETPSNVGAGWSLNAGGIITRSVRGNPDDHDYYWQNWLEAGFIGGYSADREAVHSGYYDGEADIFYYNFNGFTGKFISDKDGNVHLIPNRYQDTEINIIFV